jgi:hypothetical protein
VLAHQALQPIHALLDLGQARGVDGGALRVAGQVAADLGQLGARVLHRRRGSAERRIELGGLLQVGGQARQLVAQGLVALLQAIRGAARHVEQLPGVAQAVALQRQLLHLVGLRRQGVDALQLEGHERLALATLAVGEARGGQAGRRLLEALDVDRELLALTGESREEVEVAEVGGGIGERHAVVLRGDIAQVRRQACQLGGGAQAAVEIGARAPGRLHHAPHHQLAVAGDAGRVEDGRQAVVPAHLEQCFDLGLLGAGTHHLRAGSPAQDQPQGADDDRLARTGLAGDDVEAGLELELERVHQDEALHPQQRKHGRIGGATRARVKRARGRTTSGVTGGEGGESSCRGSRVELSRGRGVEESRSRGVEESRSRGVEESRGGEAGGRAGGVGQRMVMVRETWTGAPEKAGTTALRRVRAMQPPVCVPA